MPHRYQQTESPLFPEVKLKPFEALRQKLREGYALSDFRSDLMAGIIVGMVAIPLGMALAIASGVPPQHGLYTVIIGGGVVALLGGSRFQVTGPTAAFVVILAPIVHQFGLSGLLVAGLMAGVMLVLMGMARLGRLIQFIPYPVTTGFTAGIATVIATLQFKDFLGLYAPEMPERFLEKVVVMGRALPTFAWPELMVGLFTLGTLLVWPRINKRIPAPLIALSIVSVGTIVAGRLFPGFQIATIGSRFRYVVGGINGHGIPQALPRLMFPWAAVSADGHTAGLSYGLIASLMPSAFAITMLGAIESLLSAVVADGMAQTKHDPDAELVALGVGNILCPFFGGIAATGAIARTATNIRFGAKSPLSAVIHALFTLLVVFFFAPYVSYLPMAALAALLMLVAYNMSEVKHFIHIVRVAPKSDVAVLLLCFGLTVVFDMVVGVSVGVVLAALLFMQRMASVTSARGFIEHGHPRLSEPLPKSVLLYQIAGPLFFGAAERAVEAMAGITDEIRAIIFWVDEVPVMDVTGLVAFESALAKLSRQHREVFIVGLKPQPTRVLKKAGLLDEARGLQLYANLEDAVKVCRSKYLDTASTPLERTVR